MKVLFLTLSIVSSTICLKKTELEQSVKNMDKAELHLHLGGSWPLPFLQSIAEPDDFKALIEMLNNLNAGMEYEKAFGVFDLLSKMVNTQIKVEAGVIALCKQLARDNVTYVEIRTSVKDLGSGVEEYLQTVLRGLKKGCQGTRLKAHLILSVRRDSSEKAVHQTIDLIQKYRDQGVVGLDISGISTKGDGSAILQAVDRIKELAIPITLHLGESPDERPQQQMSELMTLKPQRIGHGVYLCKSALLWICKNKIPMELCLTSAVKVSMIKNYKDHPALRLLSSGHPVIICTDDPLLFQTTLTQECARVAQINKLTLNDLELLQKQTLSFAFAKDNYVS